MGQTERHIMVACELGFVLGLVKAARQYGHFFLCQSDGQEPISLPEWGYFRAELELLASAENRVAAI